MDPVALARVQFAFTVAYHFLFVPDQSGFEHLPGRRGPTLVQEPGGRRQGRFPVLAEALHHDLRHRCGHRHHHGVRLRHQLGDLLPLRRRHLRRSPGRGGPLRLLPRIDLPRRAAVRPRPRLAPLLLRLDLAGGPGSAPLGLLDHHRQLLAADPGRVQGRGWQSRAHRLLRRRLQPVDAAPLRAHRGLDLGCGSVHRGRHRGVLPAPGHAHPVRQEDPHRCGDLRFRHVGGHAPHRRLERKGGRRRAAGQDGGLRRALHDHREGPADHLRHRQRGCRDRERAGGRARLAELPSDGHHRRRRSPAWTPYPRTSGPRCSRPS